jgi:sulfite oxidase
MNSHPLTPAHGYPLRAIVPGIIGARSVKWLDRIIISRRESPNFYHQHDYKILPPEATSPGKAEELGLWEEGAVAPMMENPINSVVAVPGEDGDVLERDAEGRVCVKGYAIPGGKDGPVVRVEVSVDGGGKWWDAELVVGGDENTTDPANRGDGQEEGAGKFSWVLWEVRIPLERTDGVTIRSRATDKGGNTQEDGEGSWNLRGVGYNAAVGRKGIKIV